MTTSGDGEQRTTTAEETASQSRGERLVDGQNFTLTMLKAWRSLRRRDGGELKRSQSWRRDARIRSFHGYPTSLALGAELLIPACGRRGLG
jgi:hypothetical protein